MSATLYASPLIQGFLLGLGFIVAIGAQNAYVLRMGLLKHYPGVIALVCSVGDATLIAAGQLGMGRLIAANPWVALTARYAGAAFLVFYGIAVLRRAWRSESLRAAAVDAKPAFKAVLFTVLALSFLNPHIYLENVVLLGAIGASLPAASRWEFGIGAALSSAVWFFAIAYGARFLSRLLASRRSWKVLDGAIALIMFGIAAGLVVGK